MLDRLPLPLQHLLTLVLPVLLGWGSSDVVPWLHGRGGWCSLAAALLAQLLLVVTPLTRQYGVGRHAAPVSSWARSGTLALVLLLALAAAVLAPAGPVEAQERPTVYLGVTAATFCGGTLVVSYRTEQLDGRTWSGRQDDGRVDVQLAGRRLGSVSGGEARRRWTGPVPAGAMVSVVRTDGAHVASSAYPVEVCS